MQVVYLCRTSVYYGEMDGNANKVKAGEVANSAITAIDRVLKAYPAGLPGVEPIEVDGISGRSKLGKAVKRFNGAIGGE
jgi:hypothetical protein